MKCKAVKQCWRLLNLEQVRCTLMELKSGAEVVKAVMHLEEDMRQHVIHLLWCWWDARNKTNAGEKQRSAAEVVHQAQIMALEVKQLETDGSQTESRQVRHTTAWRPPGGQVLKINIDGAFIKETRKGAWGFIIRYHHGSGVAAGTGALINLHDALQAEAQALY